MDLTLIRGDTESLEVAITDALGAALNLTGAFIRFSIKASPDDADADALIVKTTAANGGVSRGANPALGIATVTLGPADTALISTGRWVYDVEVTDGNGRVSTVAMGRLSAEPDVSSA